MAESLEKGSGSEPRARASVELRGVGHDYGSLAALRGIDLLVARDEVVGYADVQLPEGRLSDALRREQDEVFFGAPAGAGERAAAAR